MAESSSTGNTPARKPRKERTSVCSYCNQSFNKKEHLERHVRTHTLARPYVCDFPDCGKTFARRDTLTRHTRLHKRDDVPSSNNSAAGSVSGEPPVGIPASSSSTSLRASLRVPRPARKRRARDGSASSTLAHDDSGEDAHSSSGEIEHQQQQQQEEEDNKDNIMHDDNDPNYEDEEEEELSHKKAPVAIKMSNMSIRPRKEEDDGDDEDEDVMPSMVHQRLSGAQRGGAGGFASAALPFAWNKLNDRSRSSSPLPRRSLAANSAAFVDPNLDSASALGLDMGLPSRESSSTSLFAKHFDSAASSSVGSGLPPFANNAVGGFRHFRNQSDAPISHDDDNVDNNNHDNSHDFNPTKQQHFLSQPQQQSANAGSGELTAASSHGSNGDIVSTNLNTNGTLASGHQPFLACDTSSSDTTQLSQPSQQLNKAAAASPATSPQFLQQSLAAVAAQAPPLLASTTLAQRLRAQNLAKMQLQKMQEIQQHRQRQFTGASDISSVSGASLRSGVENSILSGGGAGGKLSPNMNAPFLSLGGFSNGLDHNPSNCSISPTLSDNASLPSLSSSYQTSSSFSSSYLHQAMLSRNDRVGAENDPPLVPAATSDISAFKNANAFDQPMTMSIGLPMIRNSSVDSDTKSHLYMLMRAAETPTEDYLRWPSRDSSPAPQFGGYSSKTSHSSSQTDNLGTMAEYHAKMILPTSSTPIPFSSSATTASSSSSSNAPTRSSGLSSSSVSFLDFSEYDGTQGSSLFSDDRDAAALMKGENMGDSIERSRSPIASLEQWLVRQGGGMDTPNNELVF